MSHLHLPDGVLPVWLWGSGWLAAAVFIAIGLRPQGRRSVHRVAIEGALTALMLAAMAVEIPMGPIEYHLTLAGPMGVLLGAAGAFQAAFIASAMLSFVGHGGFSLIGLNALNLGVVAVTAGWIYRRLVVRWHPGPALAIATGVAQVVGGLTWAMVMMVGIRAHAGSAGAAAAPSPLVPAVAAVLIVIGAIAEALVAFGFGRFLGRVRPDLLGVPAPRASIGPTEAPRGPAGEEPRVASR